MALTVGTQLGSHEIIALLGKGGMGEVYRARDTKLKREVAIKILPDEFSRDADRMSRFQREAEVLASLNHPNIAAIYDLAEASGTRFLVLELVEGETLADQIARGPLPVEEALLIAKQICEALEAAHDKGIIHRDLKPANVKLTPDGKVKVLDFGLAKAMESTTANPALSQSPTLVTGSMAGMIMGTAAYMSPEQAAGKPLDKRSDIWSFGVVLFEMLTGRQLFEAGETVSHTLADVLRASIDFSRLPAATPTLIRDLLRRCLDRDVKNRLRDIGEARIAIDIAGKTPEPVPSSDTMRQRRSSVWITVAVAVAVIAGIAGFGWWRATRPVERPLMQFADDLGKEIYTDSSSGPAIAISPDGLRLAFISATSEGKSHLFVRPIASSNSTLLPGAEGEGTSPSAPFFSPDGRWIGFFSNNSELKKISVEGGAAVKLCDAGGVPRGGFWGDDGNILFATQRSSLMRVFQSGGTPVPATELDKTKGEVTHRFAQLLPGGKAILFTASKDSNLWGEATIDVQTISDRKRKTLVNGGYFGRYVAAPDGSGHLIYVREGTVYAAPMDLNRLELTGSAPPILEDVAVRAQSGFAQFDVSATGTVVYVAGSNRRNNRSLALVDTGGTVQVLPAPPAAYQGAPVPSPDGTRIAVGIEQSATALDLSVYEMPTKRTTRLTFLKGAVLNPAWAPDGKHLVFSILSHDLSGPGVYWMRADGAGEPQRLLDGVYLPGSFSADGKILVYSTNPNATTEYGIWMLPLDLADPEHPKPGKPEMFLASKSPLSPPSVSPDGKWLAYDLAETRPRQIFVRPFSSTLHATEGLWQISSSDGGNPPVRWTTSGNEVSYLGLDGRLYVVSYTVNGPSFSANPPRLWSQKLPTSAAGPVMMPDGKHAIVVLASPEAAAPRQTHVRFLLNFPDELQRHTRAGK